MLNSYPMYFVSYLFDHLKNVDNIVKIILYGSFAKEEQNEESDVDIFIEVKKKSENFENQVKNIVENFYSSRESALFKLKGIDNRFSIKTGKLSLWKDIERSIMSTGIILYSRYQTRNLPSETKHNIIFFWDKIGRNRGAFLNKLYGFRVNGKRYSGLIERYSGKKLGKSCVMFPIEYKDELYKLIKDYEVNSKIIEVFI